MTRRRARVVLLLTTIIAGCGVSLDSFLLLPASDFRLTPTDLQYQYEELILTGGDGLAVNAWRVRTIGTRKGCVVVVPAASGNKGRYSLVLPIFVDKGWDVVLYDYPGFGDSPGPATLAGIIEGTRTVLDYAFEQYDVVVGHSVSMGTSVLARVAVDYPLAACIFDSTTDLRGIGSDSTAYIGLPEEVGALADLLVAANTPDDFDLKRWIREVQAPKLFLHSPDDSLTPWQKVWEIFNLAPQPKHLVAAQGDHAEQIFVDPGLYRSLLNGWLDGALKLDPIQNQEYRQLLDDERRAIYQAYGLTPKA